MSVIARWAATPRTCDSANDVTACTSVAAPAASARGRAGPRCPCPITSSIRYLEVAGRTSPVSPVDEHQPEAEGEATAPRGDQRPGFFPCGRGEFLFFLLVRSGAESAGGLRSDYPSAATGSLAPRQPSTHPKCHQCYDARRRMNVSTARATPAQSLLSVSTHPRVFRYGTAFPMTMGVPANSSISISFRLSPTAMTSSRP